MSMPRRLDRADIPRTIEFPSQDKVGSDAERIDPASHLRVLHIGKYYAPFRGGIETHLKALAEGIADLVNLEVIVSNSRRLTVREIVAGVKLKRLARQFSISTAPVCLGLRDSIRPFRPDIVHIHLPNPAAVVSLLASGYKGPIVVTYHSDVIRQRFLGKLFEPALKLILGRARAIIATSSNYLNSSRSLRQFASKCRIIPYGIDADHFAVNHLERVRAIRARYGERIVLTVGRLIYYKGFEYLLDAMAHVDGNLLVVGDGPLLGALIDRARTAGVADRVWFLGEVSGRELVDLYHAARVFVLPSVARSEAFGIVQLEAMAAGLPVINTDLDSGVPSVSLHGVTGLTVPPRDSTSLASAINDLLRDERLAEMLGRAGQRRVAARFTARKMCDETLELYRDIAGASRPVARTT